MSELGSWLIRAREARGLTLEDAERDTRISRRYLQALESEQFDVIPAPVYARGFLRSYSQYLGLDPQEMLGLFPRDDEPAYATPQARPSMKEPLSAVSPARPAWRRPQPGEGVQQPPRGQSPRPARGAQAPASPFGRRPGGRNAEQPLGEPMIGVDIGVPVPKRNLGHDPAAQGRSALVAIVAIGAVLGVVMLALLISNMGSDSNPGTSPDDDGETTLNGETPIGGGGNGGGAETPEASGIPGVERGLVPDLVGHQADKAKLAIQEAGGSPVEKKQKSSKPKGEVIDQQPGPGTELPADGGVTIVVSDGP